MKKYCKLIVVLIIGIALGVSIGFGVPKHRPHFKNHPRMERSMEKRSDMKQHRGRMMHQLKSLDEVEKLAIDSLKNMLRSDEISKEDRHLIRKEIFGIIKDSK